MKAEIDIYLLVYGLAALFCGDQRRLDSHLGLEPQRVDPVHLDFYEIVLIAL